MDWVERMNLALDILEQNPSDPPDATAISRCMACPYAVFLRMFMPLTGVTLSEYVRRRRLSRAAADLQCGDLRVLDVALRYGYDSADAFTAAFKRMHGLTPQEARNPGAKLAFYPRMTFTMTLQGVQPMRYRQEKRDAFTVMGVRQTTPFGGGTWRTVKEDGSADRLAALCGHPCDLGLCFGFDAQGNNDYLCGVEWTGAVESGFTLYTYPPLHWLVFTAEGALTNNPLLLVWQRIYGEFMPTSRYQQLDFPTIEHYVLWDQQADVCHVEIHIPITAPTEPLSTESV